MSAFFRSITKRFAFLLGITVGLALWSSITCFTLHKLFSPASSLIVTVNVTGLINHYVTDMAKSHLTPEETKIHLTDFAKRLDNAIKMVSNQEHVIILPSQAVLAGTPDKTQMVVELMKTGA